MKLSKKGVYDTELACIPHLKKGKGAGAETARLQKRSDWRMIVMAIEKV
ncbi:hypothetical protein [Bacillus safensis]|nr:hypothetical protein [Bacillus safensis]